MAVYVTEHASIGVYRQPLTPSVPLAAYSLSSLSTWAGPQSTAAHWVRVSADAASLFSVSCTSTGTALTSTNAFRVPANASPEWIALSSTSFKIAAAST